MFPTIAFALEARIGITFVDCLPIQIGQPGLDVSGGDKDRHPLVRLTASGIHFRFRALNLVNSVSNLSSVGVDQNNQRLLDSVLPGPVINKLLREPLPNKMLGRPTAIRTPYDPLDSSVMAHAG